MVSIKIRADGSPEIGLGHLVRSKALGDMLKDDFDVQFFCHQIPQPIRDEFEQSGLPVTVIGGEEEYLNSLSESDIAVIDGYEFDIHYRKRVKASSLRLVCIDDLAKGEFVADLIINQSPGVQVSDYSAQNYTEFALGPDYALLRSSFFQKPSKFADPEQRKSLLICFGGSDLLNITEKAVKLALDFKEFDKITIITGSAYSHKLSLENMLKGYNHCDYYHAVSEQKMAELMQASDAAIVPASGTLFEALVTKNVVISGMYIDNQKRNYEAFKAMNAIIDAGQFGEKNIDLALHQVQKFHPVDVVDGKSHGRLISAIKRVLNRS